MVASVSVVFRALFILTGACLAYLLAMPLLQGGAIPEAVSQGILSGLFTFTVWGGLSIYVVPKRIRQDELLIAAYRRRWGVALGLIGLIFCGGLGPFVAGSGSGLGWIVTGSAVVPLALLIFATLRKPSKVFGYELEFDDDEAPFPDGGLAPPPGTDLGGRQG
jgi:hypothetical protein